ncbi:MULTISPECIES: 4-hydroxy-tetrahydrodipicolinate synthase [Ralstonia solanacearum species complex]|uniref:4-hydroxy-tetrahydrodipicolinate synthase n=4 Tax=Ralstonia solanacearum species complex TaxID=3116862 RepID=A0A0K1ZLV4_RALSL|nr:MULTISPECIES: 4-hydroxy-tetrahydrodipicolinate synthase [Ralstonia]AKZ26984.1 dihydrodipicolinate synthase [Ralstonia solanacearum]AVV67888.1 4-hydroxy-tetrahydrodipicolinate synthase [Ralstonia solanacearum OE1-1]API75155.1 4-hydroxy-tetrahydrodipicolinate synthase [Ralstonia pseudosolanacearum]ASL72316.1 4-hydroxy-tetrahydrodipicolinate synthase [Ralstonia pseudosolanacearum]AST86911.1 4-hydroxy-tetrahydrodipicolinate synthase [Ralstonia pseudosolanacearum]
MTQISGSLVAIVTPMHEDGSLDFPSLRSLIDWHIAEGTDGIVIVGTSGESPTVSVDEHRELIRVAVEQVNKRIPVIAGTGGNSTTEAVELTAYAKSVGADASLQVVPYYNKPTQEGMYLHFRKVAESVDLPVILYNVPGRTVADMSVDTMLRLAQVPGVMGVKEATGNIDRAAQLIKAAPASFKIYSGDDPTAVALMLLGGHGNISVTANVAPRAMHDLCAAAMRGDVETARRIHMQLLSVHKNLFVESNPIPVKWALQAMGKMAGGIRLPLTPLAAQYQEVVRASLQDAGLLS